MQQPISSYNSASRTVISNKGTEGKCSKFNINNLISKRKQKCKDAASCVSYSPKIWHFTFSSFLHFFVVGLVPRRPQTVFTFYRPIKSFHSVLSIYLFSFCSCEIITGYKVKKKRSMYSAVLFCNYLMHKTITMWFHGRFNQGEYIVVRLL